MRKLSMLNIILMKYSTHFFVNLAPAEDRFGYFIQDNVTPHTAKETIRTLCGVFGEFNGEDRIISKGLWPPRSTGLNPCDFSVGKNSKMLCMPTIHVWRL
jgi:hypothetical protein